MVLTSLSSLSLRFCKVGFFNIDLVLIIGGSLSTEGLRFEKGESGDVGGDRVKEDPSKSGGSCSS